MSQDEQDKKRALFWLKLRENARSIVEQQKQDMIRQTVDPSLCLLEEDREIMRDRQCRIQEYEKDQARLGGDGCASRLLALYTVLTARPRLILKL